MMEDFTQEQLEKYFAVLNEVRNDEELFNTVYEASGALRAKFGMTTIEAYKIYSRWTRHIDARAHLAHSANIFDN